MPEPDAMVAVQDYGSRHSNPAVMFAIDVRSVPKYRIVDVELLDKGLHYFLIFHQVYYVAVGAELEAGVVLKKVEHDRVTLNENGESKVYRLTGWQTAEGDYSANWKYGRSW